MTKCFLNSGLSDSLRKLKFNNCEIDDKFVEFFLKNGHILLKITHLSFKSCIKLTEISLREIINSKAFPNITSFGLSKMNIDEESLYLYAYSEMINRIKRLKLLGLKGTNLMKGLRELFTPSSSKAPKS